MYHFKSHVIYFSFSKHNKLRVTLTISSHLNQNRIYYSQWFHCDIHLPWNIWNMYHSLYGRSKHLSSKCSNNIFIRFIQINYLSNLDFIWAQFSKILISAGSYPLLCFNDELWRILFWYIEPPVVKTMGEIIITTTLYFFSYNLLSYIF